MKALVVFYSLEGHTKMVAELIASALHAETLEIKTLKDFPTRAPMKFLVGGKSVMRKEQPELKNNPIDLGNYDVIFIGSPIWAGTYASPLDSFLHQNRISGKRVAFFAAHAGGGADRCFERLKEELKGNEILGSIDFNTASKEFQELAEEKTRNWLKEILVDSCD